MFEQKGVLPEKKGSVAEVVSTARLSYIYGTHPSNSIEGEIPDRQFRCEPYMYALAGDFQATKVPRVLHMFSPQTAIRKLRR